MVLNRVEKGAIEMSECIEWTGFRDKWGYGKTKQWIMREGVRFRKSTSAHRVALEAKLGRPIAEGLRALHSCDNPPCINPDHLREGTPGENNRDAVARGRWTQGRKSYDFCKRGHDLRAPGGRSYFSNGGSRCKECHRARGYERVTRPCAGCSGKRTCRWADDAWVCGSCGSEWFKDHGPEYAAPGETE